MTQRSLLNADYPLFRIADVRYRDLLAIAFSALLQQKSRTFLTVAGVVIGTFVLVVSLALGRGFEQEAMRQLNRGSLSRQVMVWPGSGVREADIPAEKLQVRGRMTRAKRARIRQAIIHRWPVKTRGVQLDSERISLLSSLPHVDSVVPIFERYCQVSLKGQPALPVLTFAANSDNEHFRKRIVAGRHLNSDTDRSVVISEYLAYLWGITDDDDVGKVIGKKLRIEHRTGSQTPKFLLSLLRGSKLELSPEQWQALEKLINDMPTQPRGEIIFSEQFTIVGVMREFFKDDDFNDVFDMGTGTRSWDADVFLPAKTAMDLFSRGDHRQPFGFPGVIVTVDEEKNTKQVVHNIRSLGLQEYSLLDFVQGFRTSLVLISFVTAFLAAVALLVAALGITNTMTMTVLERTREIGIMKAVGARDGTIQLMFLVEGALIGLIGGSVGVFLGWLASFPGDTIARALLKEQNLNYFDGSLFVFPLWLTVGLPLFAGLVTTLAAAYPARRATRINPIMALRHE